MCLSSVHVPVRVLVRLGKAVSVAWTYVYVIALVIRPYFHSGGIWTAPPASSLGSLVCRVCALLRACVHLRAWCLDAGRGVVFLTRCVLSSRSCVCILLVAGYLVDPASSHMLVSKIKPCMSKYKRLVL